MVVLAFELVKSCMVSWFRVCSFRVCSFRVCSTRHALWPVRLPCRFGRPQTHTPRRTPAQAQLGARWVRGPERKRAAPLWEAAPRRRDLYVLLRRRGHLPCAQLGDPADLYLGHGTARPPQGVSSLDDRRISLVAFCWLIAMPSIRDDVTASGRARRDLRCVCEEFTRVCNAPLRSSIYGGRCSSPRSAARRLSFELPR